MGNQNIWYISIWVNSKKIVGSARNRIAYRLRSLVGTEKIGDLSIIDKYCTSIHLIREDYLSYIKLCSPFIAQLPSETRVKIYELSWSLLFGDEGKKDKVEEAKKVMQEIKEEFKKLQTGVGREIYSDTGPQFLENIKKQL